MDSRQKLADALAKSIVAVLDYHSEQWEFKGMEQTFDAEPHQDAKGNHLGVARKIRLDFSFFQPAGEPGR